MRKILVLLIFVMFLINFVLATCTVTLDKDSYIAGETATAAMVCDAATEKSDGYILNWTNASSVFFEADAGTTPSTVGQTFYESYIIPSNWPSGVYVNATLVGSDNNDLEGTDYANVSTTAGTNSLVITNTTIGGNLIGKVSSIKEIVRDENSKTISGGLCKMSVWSNDETQMMITKEGAIFNGETKFDFIMDNSRFEEGVDYAIKLICYCGSSGSNTECIDEDGTIVNNSVGQAVNAFTVGRWLNVNTIVDAQVYELREDIFICANVTNVNYSRRIRIPVHYEARCSAGDDNNDDLDRILIINDESQDERGISPNTTQMQCKKFQIPEINYLEGQTSTCYASTSVDVLDESNNIIISYHTTSPMFNITNTELNLNPDWQWRSSTRVNSIVNLSSSGFKDFNGTGTGNIDLKLRSIMDRLDIMNAFNLFNSIANVTIMNLSGEMTEHTDYELEFTDDDNVEIELRNVDLSKYSGAGWWNITLDFYDFENRQTVALEGINNKTGTFHLAVDCPATAGVGGNMNCTISAQVEDSQIAQKEVDFTCYVTDGITEFSSLNFNQMINKTLFTTSREFLVPSSFSQGTQYVLQCHADYYNFGSRRDSFYDTFVTSVGGLASSDSSGTSPVESKGVPITGGAIEEEEGGEGIIHFIPDERNEWIIFAVVLLIVIGALFILIKKKRKFNPHKKSSRLIFKIIGFIFAGLLLIILGIYIFNFVTSKSAIILEGVSNSLGSDPLFRGMILTTFIVLIVIILFKALNIKMEIRLGEHFSDRRYYEDRKTIKLQHKINQEILKHELKLAKKRRQ